LTFLKKFVIIIIEKIERRKFMYCFQYQVEVYNDIEDNFYKEEGVVCSTSNKYASAVEELVDIYGEDNIEAILYLAYLDIDILTKNDLKEIVWRDENENG
jgi:hypothetical protein